MPWKQEDIIRGFNDIATNYDSSNNLMTLGFHRLWRNQLIHSVVASHKHRSSCKILDLGTGTGDVAISLAKSLPQAHILGVDPSATMLEQAKKKAAHISTTTASIHWLHAEAANLNIPPHSLDAITMAWVIRNIQNPKETLQRLHNLLLPHGTIHILESGRPISPFVQLFYPIYSKLFPYIGGLISKRRDFYDYYRRSVDSFPFHTSFLQILTEAGFHRPHSRPLWGGVVYLYTAHAQP
ncbi:MAG: ubiquinone/menaquinone biosynthesis methyltransferase [Methylacidiphilales bacterium]|nr:ubiquinone/menaquinone biosynthesis methyltransferase [Candidatus Methylacidiphilales bacterium]MDW8348937.1 ubiquinone/menaquinone biosynthesis methyltransferase [Verrucomicrobiae bacterium]